MSDSDPRGPAERYGENPDGSPRRVDHRIEGEGRYAGERNDGVATGADEGRDADRPSDIPPRGWKAVGSRVVEQLREDHASLLAAGVAFKALLALFPAIIAALSIWGLVASPEQIAEQLAGLTDALPDEAAAIIEQQLAEVAAGGTGALSVALPCPSSSRSGAPRRVWLVSSRGALPPTTRWTVGPSCASVVSRCS